MARKKTEEVVPAVEAVEAAEPAKKTRKPRAKKEAAEGAAAPAEKPARKPRAPRKKKVVPNFVIQNNAEDGITYASVVEKVQAAITIQDVTSLDIYVKAEEGKAYYVVNGEAVGAVDLFTEWSCIFRFRIPMSGYTEHLGKSVSFSIRFYFFT